MAMSPTRILAMALTLSTAIFVGIYTRGAFPSSSYNTGVASCDTNNTTDDTTTDDKADEKKTPVPQPDTGLLKESLAKQKAAEEQLKALKASEQTNAAKIRALEQDKEQTDALLKTANEKVSKMDGRNQDSAVNTYCKFITHLYTRSGGKRLPEKNVLRDFSDTVEAHMAFAIMGDTGDIFREVNDKDFSSSAAQLSSGQPLSDVDVEVLAQSRGRDGYSIQELKNFLTEDGGGFVPGNKESLAEQLFARLESGSVAPEPPSSRSKKTATNFRGMKAPFVLDSNHKETKLYGHKNKCQSDQAADLAKKFSEYQINRMRLLMKLSKGDLVIPKANGRSEKITLKTEAMMKRKLDGTRMNTLCANANRVPILRVGVDAVQSPLKQKYAGQTYLTENPEIVKDVNNFNSDIVIDSTSFLSGLGKEQFRDMFKVNCKVVDREDSGKDMAMASMIHDWTRHLMNDDELYERDGSDWMSMKENLAGAIMTKLKVEIPKAQ
jgi:hypothetical protein